MCRAWVSMDMCTRIIFDPEVKLQKRNTLQSLQNISRSLKMCNKDQPMLFQTLLHLHVRRHIWFSNGGQFNLYFRRWQRMKKGKAINKVIGIGCTRVTASHYCATTSWWTEKIPSQFLIQPSGIHTARLPYPVGSLTEGFSL